MCITVYRAAQLAAIIGHYMHKVRAMSLMYEIHNCEMITKK